jgi:hypothetical protein
VDVAMSAAAGPAAYGDIGVMGASSWETMIDAIATRGMEFRRDPFPIALYVGFGLLLTGISWTPALMSPKGDLPLEVLGLTTLGIAALMLVARIADVVSARRLMLEDDGIESSRGGQRLARIQWRTLSRAGFPPFFVSPLVGRSGDAIWLPGTFMGREFLAGCIAWCYENRAEITSNGGSMTRALDTIAKRDGISFGFDWMSSISATAIMGGLVAGMIAITILDDTPLAEQSLITIGTWIVMFCIFGTLFAFAVHGWTDVSTRVVVSSHGVAEVKNGKTIAALTWDDIVQADALKWRRERGVLACDASGRTVITSDNIRGSEFLDAVVDHFLVHELKRRDTLRALAPVDVWGKLDD